MDGFGAELIIPFFYDDVHGDDDDEAACAASCSYSTTNVPVMARSNLLPRIVVHSGSAVVGGQRCCGCPPLEKSVMGKAK